MNIFQCPLCKKVFKNIEDFSEHLNNPVCKMVSDNNIDKLLEYKK
jgi:uncharacterized C2H2 Zn-finger protein